MYIQCTQKLLNQLGRSYDKLPVLPEPIYCWHADSFEVGGAPYVIMVNDGLGIEEFLMFDPSQDFETQVHKEMGFDMKRDGFSDTELVSYVKQAGALTFGPTGGRSYVTRLNSHIRNAKSFTTQMQEFMDEVQSVDPLEELAIRFDAVMDRLVQEEAKSTAKPKKKPRVPAKGKIS